MDVAGPRTDASERADVDDAPGAKLLHLTRGFLAAEEGCFQIDTVNEIPVFFRDVEGSDPGETCGVVDQVLERAELVANFAKEAADLSDFGEIGLEDRGIPAGARNFLGFGSRS